MSGIAGAVADDGYVYHYTGAGPILKIIETRKLWATHWQYLNDGLEGRHMVDALQMAVGSVIESNPMHVKLVTENLLSHLKNVPDIFIASFSSRPDLLTQYRMYSPNSGGFAIGFPKTMLSEITFPSRRANVVQVKYERREQIDTSLAFVEKIYRLVNAAVALADHPLVPIAREARITEAITNSGLLNEVWDLCVARKSDEFSSEQETRVVIRGDISGSERKLRPSTNGNLFVPYVELDLPDIDVVVRVSTGPGYARHLAQAGIRHLQEYAASVNARWKIEHYEPRRSWGHQA